MSDDRQSKDTSLMGADEVAKLTAKQREPSAGATPAKGSDGIHRERMRPADTVPVGADEMSGLVELSELLVAQKPSGDVVALEADDKKTRKMDPEQFRALLKQQAAPTPAAEPSAAPRKDMSTGELMAQVDEAFADFGPAAEPVADPPPSAPTVDAASKPVKKPALIVADHRIDTRYASRIAPITKPPAEQPVEATPSAPSSSAAASRVHRDEVPPSSSSSSPSAIDVVRPARSPHMVVLIGVLGIALLVAMIVLLT